MLNSQDITEPGSGEFKYELLRRARIQLRMNLSLLEMLKGNTSLEDMAHLRQEWVDPVQELVRKLENP